MVIADNLDRCFSMKQTNKFRQITIGRAAIGANALGALAVGALAIGALAIGRLVIGRLMVGRANAKSVSIEDLTIARLRVGELDGDRFIQYAGFLRPQMNANAADAQSRFRTCAP